MGKTRSARVSEPAHVGHSQPLRRKKIASAAALTTVNAIEPQKTTAESYGMKATKFWPKKLVTMVMTKRIVATAVRTFITSFSRLETAARFASTMLLTRSRNVSISSVTRTTWSYTSWKYRRSSGP